MNGPLLEKVKDYFSGTMSREEELLFEEEMKTNSRLADLCALYQTIEGGIEDTKEYPEEEALLRNSFQKWHQQYLNEHQQNADPLTATPEAALPLAEAARPNIAGEEHTKIRRIKEWKALAIAATVMGIMLIGIFWYLQKEKNRIELADRKEKAEESRNKEMPDTAHTKENTAGENIATHDNNITPGPQADSSKQKKPVLDRAQRETLYAQNFKPDAVPSRYPELLQEALEQYKKGAYKDAVAAMDIDALKTSLEELRPRGQQDAALEREEEQTLFYAHYYRALSYMADVTPEKAIPELRAAITKATNQLWQSKARWYLALAYLKSGNLTEATRLFNEIAKTKNAGAYKQRALKLINGLEKNK